MHVYIQEIIDILYVEDIYWCDFIAGSDHCIQYIYRDVQYIYILYMYAHLCTYLSKEVENYS